MGDFSAILNEEDRQHGSQVQDIETRDFRDFLTESAMIELQTYGGEYTWTNNHTYSRIDRAIVNAAWMNGMPVSQVQIMEPQFSHHSPLKIKFDQYTGEKNKPFRFFNCIAEHQDFLPLIEDCWKLPTPKTYMRSVSNKLKCIKQRLKTLNIEQFKGVEGKLKHIMNQLREIQERMGQHKQDSILIEEEKKLRRQLET
ncbi:uncharacterized protein [Nicotiana sylvestris]|uniref:uncharacterized protein n=1 Tax=Nicotiana sylvestris TaxID=4096 RepID=UPI00388C735F